MAEEECPDCPPVGSPAWMATFSDLATLLLTFFILLLSFAELNVIVFRDMVGSVRNAFGVQFITPGSIQAMSTTPVELNSQPTSRIMNLNEQEMSALRTMRGHLAQRAQHNDAEVVITPKGIIVRIRDRILFETGSATLLEDAYPVLNDVADLAQVFQDGLSIEGHTDPRPIHTSVFPSNWELSSSRAISVLRYFVDERELNRDTVRVAGYADTHPLAPNDSEENMQRNRRVEFVFNRPRARDDLEQETAYRPFNLFEAESADILPPDIRGLIGPRLATPTGVSIQHQQSFVGLLDDEDAADGIDRDDPAYIESDEEPDEDDEIDDFDP